MTLYNTQMNACFQTHKVGHVIPQLCSSLSSQDCEWLAIT